MSDKNTLSGDCIFPEVDTFVYLTGVSTPEARAANRPSLGLLAQPGNSTHLDFENYQFFAADNGCFAEAQGKSWDRARWINWLADEIVDRADRCLFATAPDVVGDAAATLRRSAEWLDVIRELGLPAALVAQDGLEDLDVPWADFDVLFIGGSTEWKLSPHARKLSEEARSRGLWVHMGRVNSWKRLQIALDSSCDSADGTFLGFAPKTNWARLTAWLDKLETQERIAA